MSHDGTIPDVHAVDIERVNPEVRYRCTGEGCEGRDTDRQSRLSALADRGCGICGRKLVEIWHPKRGHLIIDFRSQKSVRKKRRP